MKPGFSPPGAGFVILVIAWGLVIGFLWWGASSPLLDRVWRMTQRMQHADFRGLTDEEAADLEEALRRHPDLGREILGARAARIVEPATRRWCSLPLQHLVVSEEWSDQVLVVETDLVPDALPVELRLDGPGVAALLEIEEPGEVTVPLAPSTGSGPVMVKVRLFPAPDPSAGSGIRFSTRPGEVVP